MKYVGGKSRHWREILSIVLKDRDNRPYVEPFVGGFNVMCHVSGGQRIASDVHFYLIELFKSVQRGWHPPTVVTEEEYKQVRDNPHNYDPAYVGFVGFACSYGSKWFGGYARGKNNKGEPRNYADEGARHLTRQAQGIQGVLIENKSYDTLTIPNESIIYCDPPYKGTLQYKTEPFDHDHFWSWCRWQHYNNNATVYVSEYTAPDDFECVWMKTVNNTLVRNTGAKQGIEKLFRIKEL